MDIADDRAEALLVELQRLRDVVENAKVVDDEPVGLQIAAGAVGAADGLEQGVVPQRLVQIHRLQYRRVEPGEELGRDDQELQRIVRIAEAIEQLLLLVAAPVVWPVAAGPCRVAEMTIVACFGPQVLV